MIITITLNPSVDRTVEIDTLTRGAVMRANSVRVDPGGKGINVARALARNLHKTRAVVPKGGSEGDHLISLLAAEGIDTVEVPIGAAIRSNITVVEPDGTTTKFNEPGAPFTAAELSRLVDAFLSAAAGAEWAVVSGSVPPGTPEHFYADLLGMLAGIGTPTALDSSGPALASALVACPVLIKPNREELSELSGRRVSTVGDALDAAESLLHNGVRTVLVSLGSDGALLVTSDGAWHAEAPVDQPRSSVGAGDALLAGFLAAGADGPAALMEAVAWGAAAVSLPGSRMPGPDDINRDAARLHPSVDRGRALTDCR
jgi:1-phosphofructokinase